MHRCNDDVFPCRAAVHTHSPRQAGIMDALRHDLFTARRLNESIWAGTQGSRLGVAGGVDRADSLIVWTAWCMRASMWNLSRHPRHAIQGVPSTTFRHCVSAKFSLALPAEPRRRNLASRLLSERVSSLIQSGTSKQSWDAW